MSRGATTADDDDGGQVKTATGASAWALGLLILLPVPLLGATLAGLGMATAHRSLSRQGPLAAQNAAAARRWGMLFLLVSTGLLVLQVVVRVPSVIRQEAVDLLPMGIPILLYVLVCAIHLVVVVIGMTQASRGEVAFSRRAAS
ncbi:MAG: hypothetical protein WA971_04315 [Microbacterium sp.]